MDMCSLYHPLTIDVHRCTLMDMDDRVLEFMQRNKIPATRENYLDVAFMGTPPDVLDAEEEAELPTEFRRGEPGDWEDIE
jgi:hypothetical protein